MQKYILFFSLIFLVACTGTPTPAPTNLPILGDPTTTQPENNGINPPTDSPATPLVLSETPIPTEIPRSLTICLGAEPDSLYLYGSNMHVQRNILEAVYDGPIDTNGYDFQPVILEKLPSLADGDAALLPVTVREGDLVVDSVGDVVALIPGVEIFPQGCQSPACAVTFEGGETQMDQLSAEFTILDGIKWSDGTMMTTRDTVFSFRTAIQCTDPFGGACGGNGLVAGGQGTLERTASYDAIDERTVLWTGLPGFLDQNYRTNFFHPLPAHQLDSLPPEALFDAEQTRARPMGWGPYAIVEWINGRSIRLSKNPHYFRAKEGMPFFTDLEFLFFEGPQISEDQILAGTCDVLDIEAASGIPLDRLIGLGEEGALLANITPIAVWEHLDFGIVPAAYDDGYDFGYERMDFFGDARTRQAIAHCLDRESVVDTLFLGYSTVPNAFIPSDHPLYNPNIPTYAWDTNRGIELLEEVGWLDADGNPDTPRTARGVSNVLDGTPLILSYRTTTAEQRQIAADILTNSLELCGIGVNLEFMSSDAFFAEGPIGPLFGRQFDLGQFAWGTGVEPPCELWQSDYIPGDPAQPSADRQIAFPYGWGGANVSGYNNAAYDAACSTAQEALPGQTGYLETYYAVQEIFATDLPVVPLYQRVWVTAARTDMCGFTPNSTGRSDFWGIEGFNFGEGCR